MVRILIALSAAFVCSRHQLEVKGAFLYANFPENASIYMKIPTVEGVPEADG